MRERESARRTNLAVIVTYAMENRRRRRRKNAMLTAAVFAVLAAAHVAAEAQEGASLLRQLTAGQSEARRNSGGRPTESTPNSPELQSRSLAAKIHMAASSFFADAAATNFHSSNSSSSDSGGGESSCLHHEAIISLAQS